MGFIAVSCQRDWPTTRHFKHGRDDVVAVFENIRLHHHVLADDALDRVATAVDQRLQVFDDGGGELAGHRHQSTEIHG